MAGLRRLRMKRAIRTALFAGFVLFALPLAADCPAQYPCPYDGEAGHKTGYCKGGGLTPRSCEYKHIDLRKHETHVYWVACGK